MSSFRGVVLVLATVLAVPAVAAEPNLDELKAEIVRSFPETAAATLRPSPLPGFYELGLGAHVYYVSADGKYLMLGDLVDVRTRTNLTDGRRDQAVQGLLRELDEQSMIVMAPKTVRHTITVFTDVDCPYCAKLHRDVPELNRRGVKVRYALYPRAGLDSETYRRSVAVWCAPDRIQAVGVAKSGGRLEMKTCDNPVERHYRLGERLVISGTPTIFLENGKRIPGYVPPARLLALIESGSRQTVAQ